MHFGYLRGRAIALAIIAFFLAAGCATVPRDPATRAEFKANNDPIEPLNRRIFAFNLLVDRVLIKPLAQGYRRTLPGQARDAIHHFIDNLNGPVVLANCVLQGRLKSAGIAGGRFVVNSTVGIAGFGDVATGWKLPKQIGDFGQTLWAWGMAEGPYLIIPLFGPSNPRDGVGQGIVDTLFDPFRYVPRNREYSSAFAAGRVIVGGIDERARHLDSLDEIRREAIDYYASFRSLYRQNRAAELRGSQATKALPPADFYDDPGR